MLYFQDIGLSKALNSLNDFQCRLRSDYSIYNTV